MASDDVIELGSSDEDSEPAPKKRKPPVNAMVHIANHHTKTPNKLPEIKLPEITIIPSKSSSSSSSTKINPACIAKGSIGKSVTVTKVPKSNVKPILEKRINGLPLKAQTPVKQFVQIPIQKSSVPGSLPGFHMVRPLKVIKPAVVHKTGINPFNKIGVKSFSRPNLVNTNVNPLNIVNMMKPNMSMPSMVSNTVSIIKGPNPRTVLPPGITVKRTAAASLKTTSAKRSKHPPKVVHMAKPSVLTTNEILTVDLDDDEPGTSSASGPQWYLRPEEGEKSLKDTKISDEALDDDTPSKETKKEDETKIVEKEKSPVKSQKQSPDKVAEKLPVASDTKTSLEHENNKEPDKSNFIEITIDDSPIKPSQNKKGFKVGAELAIIIEDSPVKNTADKTVPSTNSDDDTVVSPKERNSKKKIEYPKNIEMLETVEIEFEPLPVEKSSNTEDKSEKPSNTESKSEKPSNTKDKSEKLSNTEENSEKPSNIAADNSNKPKRVVECIEVVEIEESPVKPLEIVQTSTPTKNKPSRPTYKGSDIETFVLDNKEKEEFHSVYQSFIKLCFQLENSEDMNKIVEKKIKAYYRQVPKEYTNSEAFTDMVSSKIMAMKAGPEKMYLYIKDVVDELNLQRKMAKAQPPGEGATIEEQKKFLYGEDSEFDAKRQRQIRKLEKTLKKLHRAIQKLEEQEVDFDDEEDSVYLLTDSEDETSKEDKPLNKEVYLQRYKERMVRVHAKLCQLTNTKMPSEARVVIDARPGQPKGPAKRLEKWINRKVPIGKPLPFPDFHDVVRCVRDANQEDKLGWNEADIMSEARDLFTRCGKKLQRRRQEYEWRLAASRIPADEQDPAEASTDLKMKLEENRRMSSKKESEVFNKYADRQNQLNLEAVEIGDKEAEESPVESDDEEPGNDTVSLISKQKRKERIKRLLKEKSKKVSISEKENKPDGSSAKGEISPNENNSVINSNEPGNSTKHLDKLEDQNPLKPTSPKSSVNSDLHDSENKAAVDTDSCTNNKDDTVQHSDKVHSLSDDSDKVDSDVDELHLLLRLRSKNECNTSPTDSSDSATPIAISDSTSTNDVSSDEHSKKQTSDVISIENSSYSESDEKKSSSLKDIIETDDISNKKVIEEPIYATMEIECFIDGAEKNSNNETNNADYNQSLEDVLLASSDDADYTEKTKRINPVNETSVNLRDDNISIGETVIEQSQKHCKDSADETTADNFDKDTNTDASSVEGMEIGPTEINFEKQNGMELTVDTASVNSADDGSTTEITSLKSPEVNEEKHAETTRAMSVETIVDENTNDTKSIKSVEIIEDVNFNDTTSLEVASFIEPLEESVITNDKTIVKETTIFEPANAISHKNVEEITREKSVDIKIAKGPKCVKPVEALDVNQATCVKSVENIDKDIIDNNKNVSKNDGDVVDAIEGRNINDTTNEKSKTIEEESSGETIVESGETLSLAIFNVNVDLKEHELTSVKPVQTLDGRNVNQTTCVKSVENINKDIIINNSNNVSKNGREIVNAIEGRDVNDTTNVKSKTIGEESSGEILIESGNIASVHVDLKEQEPTSVKSVETIGDENVEMSVNDKSVNETACENIDSDIIIEKSRQSSKNEKYVDMDTTDNTKCKLAEEMKNNSDVIPESMDVDSNVDQDFGI